MNNNGHEQRELASAISREVMRAEAAAIKRAEVAVMSAAFRTFCVKLTRLRGMGNKLVVTGVGKSAIVARKISATMATVHIPSVFIDPIGLYHGELGALVTDDIILMVSHSGMAEELLRLLEPVRNMNAEIYTLVGVKESTLGQLDNAIITGVDREAWLRIPTCSSAAAVAIGDAAACTAARLNGYNNDLLASVHPGGKIGKDLVTK